MPSSPRAYLFWPEKSSFLTFGLLFLLSIFLFVILSSPVLAATLKKPKAVSPKGNGSEAHPTFVWKSVDTATEYSLWIKSAGALLFDQRLSATEAGCVVGGDCSFQPTISLTPEKRVNWRVRAFNDTERSRWSSTRRYTLKGPKSPRTRTPRNTIGVSEADYIWRSVADAVSYELMVRQGSNELFVGTISAADAGCASDSGDCSYKPSLALDNGNYKWRVRAISVQDVAGKWSGFRTFRVRGVVITNQQPVADDQSVSVDEGGSVDITLSASDADGDTLTYTVTQPANGNLRGTAPDLTYIPNADFVGTDTFTFTVNDGTEDSAPATVTVTVNNVNVEPVAEDQSVPVEEDGSVAITLSATDVDGDALTYAVVLQPTNGSLTGTVPNLTYTPDADFNGTDSFTFIANDGELDSAEATVSIVISPVPEQPQNVTATAGDGQVQLNWDEVADADSYAVCVAETTIVDPVNCTGGIPLTAAVNSLLIDGNLANDTEYFFVVLAVANVDGSPVYSVAGTEVTATPQGIVQPTPTGRLNDTGIATCSDYAYGGSGNHNNDVDCSLTVDADGDPVPAGQDGHSGRDVTDNDLTDGHAGFDFTKIDANGLALPASATEWSCVKDSVTGLIWENKTDDGGLHDKDERFTWYSTDSTNNGGFAGFARPSDHDVNSDDAICGSHDASDTVGTTWCNTSAFVNRVNAAGLCGGNDWRLPTREELRSIVSYDRVNPALDDNYFRNTLNLDYWSSSVAAVSASSNSPAWTIQFFSGIDGRDSKNLFLPVRLVRSGQ